MCKCSVIDIPIVGEPINYGPTILKEESAQTFHLNITKNNLRFERSIDKWSEKLLTTPKPDITKTDRIYLNCSSNNIECGRIVCLIGPLKNDQDIGGLQLGFSLDPSIFIDENKQEQIIEFMTEAWIDVIMPGINQTGHKTLTRISTIFHNFGKVKRISIWIIIGSVLLGLVVLFIIAIALWLAS